MNIVSKCCGYDLSEGCNICPHCEEVCESEIEEGINPYNLDEQTDAEWQEEMYQQSEMMRG